MTTTNQPVDSTFMTTKQQSNPIMLNFDLITVLLTFWYIGGLFIDGWAHNHGRTDATFFTTWHAVFYSGYGVLALFYGWTVSRNVQAGKRWQDALPKGHHLSLLGLMIFGFGGLFDMVWHTLFGIEEDIEALLSPAHLILGVGMILVFSGAFRSFQHKQKRDGGWGDWFPAVLSVTFTVSALLFFVQYFSLTESVIGYQIGEEEARASNNQLYTMNLDGTSQTRLTTAADVNQYFPAFSPDASKIAYVEEVEMGNTIIYVMDADGSNVVRLTTVEADHRDPVFSPDGSQIAFTRDLNGNSDIYVVNVDGSSETRITDDAALDGAPDWSPDGSQFVFESNRDGMSDIYVMDADGSNIVRLTDDDAYDGLPAWSPDSSLIAFFSNRTDDNGDIYVMNVDGSNVTRVTTDEEFDGYPEWSPDGSHLIFMSWRDNNQELYSVTLDGEDETNLTNNPTMHEALASIADDGTIAYRANIASPLELDDANQLLLVYGIATMFISTVLLVGAMLVLVREGRPPFGAMTLLWTVAFALVATQDDGYLMIPLGLATGLIADILLRVLNVRYEVPGRFVLFAFLVPVVYFIIYFVLFQFMVGEIGWTIDVWSGSIFLAGIVASLLAYAMLPGSQQTQSS